MASRLLTAPGVRCNPQALFAERAQQLYRTLTLGDSPYTEFVECRRSTNASIVVFNVEVELSQKRVNPIQRIEQIAVLFDFSDKRPPEVLALRSDFPSVPHLNLRPRAIPRSICLYSDSWRDTKRNWTPIGFLEMIRTWLRLTARGQLHAQDQPLEPLLFGTPDVLLVPNNLFTASGNSINPAELITVTELTHTPFNRVLLAQRPTADEETTDRQTLALLLVAAPQQHGLISSAPQNLAELDTFLRPVGISLIDELREIIGSSLPEDTTTPEGKRFLKTRLTILVALPKTRFSSETHEVIDYWAFSAQQDIATLGKDIGIWTWNPEKTRLGILIPPSHENPGAQTTLEMMNPIPAISRATLSYISGLEENLETRIMAIGAGALGSNVILTSARSGFGQWTVVDYDILLPHNLARHALTSNHVGLPKASSISDVANGLTGDEDTFAPLIADVLPTGEDRSRIIDQANETDLILDMAASVTVSRFLARDLESSAPRISLFLNPTGQDLVLLAEDANRTTRLDAIEMQYYRNLISNTALSGHLEAEINRVRYGQTCRDLSSRIPQTYIGLHAAIATHAIQEIVSDGKAHISVWRASNDMNVTRVDIPVSPVKEERFNDWLVVTDEYAVNRLQTLRESRLPNETGGILIGSYDFERKILYITDTIHSPPDSTEWPTVYIRGCRGLGRKVQRISKQTDGNLQYVGEWHSHPNGVSTEPSGNDIRVFHWLEAIMRNDGFPTVMMIVGEHASSIFIDRIEQRATPFLIPQGDTDPAPTDNENWSKP